MKYNAQGQSLVEYIIIVGVVMTAVYFMAPSFKRGTQSIIKATADQLAAQENSEQDYSAGSSHLDTSNSMVSMGSNKEIYETAAGTQTIVSETSQTFTNTVTNAGIN
jgi:hypothetical protein